MKFLHLSDLHIGKRVNEFSMLDDQAHILACILNIADREKPDAVIIAGDVYDKSVPSGEAVQLFDDFLCSLARRSFKTFVISGNHDSPERLAFASRLIEGCGVYISPVYDGHIEPVSVEDGQGITDFYMLPFIKPAHVRRAFPEEQISSYTDAVATAIQALNIDKSRRNVLITHQFVTGASRSESEEISVGGSDNVEASVFEGFDYVALGHIHGPQNIGSPRIRYCGTPLKYSFSECGHEKSVTVVTLDGKSEPEIKTLPLVPKRDMREIRGSYMELTARSFYEGTATDDYLHITLTDEEDIPDVIGKLRVIYPNIMKLSYDNRRSRAAGELSVESTQRKSPFELFAALYEQQNGQPMSPQQAEYSAALMEEIWEGSK